MRYAAIPLRPSAAGSKGGRAFDEVVLAAVRALHEQGATSVSVVGASMGGGAAALAATRAKRGEIDRLVLLAPVPIDSPETIHAARTTDIVSRGERMFSAVRSLYDRVPELKALRVLDGSAHAQNALATDEAGKLTTWILEGLAP